MRQRRLRIWYFSTQRIFELFASASIAPWVREEVGRGVRSVADGMSQPLLSYIEQHQVPSLHALAALGAVSVGSMFTLQARFFSRGLAARNKSPAVEFRTELDGLLNEKVLKIYFGKDGLANQTAWTHLSGKPNVFVFASITDVTSSEVCAVPYVIADLVEASTSIFEPDFANSLQIRPEEVGQFEGVDFRSPVSPKDLESLRHIPEREIKKFLCALLGEAVIPNDWGGEEHDLFTSNLIVRGSKRTAAFLLKGPARFSEMTLAHCGRNADQIYRLFHAPADIFVVQHCHKISPAVRRTVEAFALAKYARDVSYLLIDGYDTARILRYHRALD